MTAIHVPDSQQCRSGSPISFFDHMHTLRAGHAVSLQCRSKRMELRLLDSSGPAWITQSPPDTRHGQEESEDTILAAGQTLQIERGSHLVMEPVSGQAVRYQWVRAARLIAQ